MIESMKKLAKKVDSPWKISKAYQDTRHQCKGTIWCNNGITNKRCLENEIPEGFIKGRIPFEWGNQYRKKIENIGDKNNE